MRRDIIGDKTNSVDSKSALGEFVIVVVNFEDVEDEVELAVV